MTIFRLSGSTSLIPNNLIFYKEENENVAVVATKGGVLIGQNQKIKIESEIISLIKLPKYRLAIVRWGFKASDWLSAFCSRAPSILKTLLSEYQINQLQIKFNEKKYLSMAERAEIAITLNITQNQVKIWFQVSFRHLFLVIA